MPTFSVQPTLSNTLVTIVPLQQHHFEKLYVAASDKETWAQHPNPLRYQKSHFQKFFTGALESKGAFVVINNATNKIIGSTRFYDYDAENNTIFIGYTFLQFQFWGGKYNPSIKKLLLEYIFQYVNEVHFHVGAKNVRSQTAMERLGAKKVKEAEVAYFGEEKQINFEYVITKSSNGKL